MPFIKAYETVNSQKIHLISRLFFSLVDKSDYTSSQNLI